jgi:hypothetical protein
VFTFIDSKPLVIGDYEFPYWSHVFGMLMNVLVLAGIIGMIAYEVFLKFKFNRVSI